MRDVTQGEFGPKTGVSTRYSGDFLNAKGGERILYPQDLISDTKELYQHAKSAGRSVLQERRLTVVGEGPTFVSVIVEDKGETGALKSFFHSACKTVDSRSGKRLKLEDVVGKERAPRLVEDGQRQFAERPESVQYRFMASSFVVLEAGARVRFCNPRRAEELGSGRLDIESTAK